MRSPSESVPSKVPNELHALQQKLAFESQQWKAGWLRSVDAARIVWNRVTYDELLQSGGDAQKLSDLVGQHYALGSGEASRQVTEFLGQCGTWS